MAVITKVKTEGAKKRNTPPRPTPDLPKEVVLRLIVRANQYSILHAMACTCKQWSSFVEPEIRSLRPIAFSFAKPVDPERKFLTIFEPETARGFAFAYLISTLCSHAEDEAPEDVIELSRGFIKVMQTTQAPVRDVMSYFHMLRGMTALRLTQLLSCFTAPTEKLLFRLAITSHSKAGQVFFFSSHLDDARLKVTEDLKKLRFDEKSYKSLIVTADRWAADYAGAEHIPEILFDILQESKSSTYQIACHHFSPQTLLSILNRPEIGLEKRTELLEGLVGRVHKGLAGSARTLPSGVEPDVINALNEWLSLLPKKLPATLLDEFAHSLLDVTRKVLGPFQFDNVPQASLKRFVLLLAERKKGGCPDASFLLNVLQNEKIVTESEIKAWKKEKKS